MALHHTCGRCTRHPCEYNACKELLQHHSLPIVQNVWQDHFISLQICFVSSVWRFRRKLVFIATWEDLRVAPGGTVHARWDYNTIDCKLSQKYARMTSFQYSDHSLPPYVVKRLNRSETPMGRMYSSFLWVQYIQSGTTIPLTLNCLTSMAGIPDSTAEKLHLVRASLNVQRQVNHSWEAYTERLYGFKRCRVIPRPRYLPGIQKGWRE